MSASLPGSEVIVDLTHLLSMGLRPRALCCITLCNGCWNSLGQVHALPLQSGS
jgi:hypothetical protein